MLQTMSGFQPFEVTIPHIIYASLGGFTVLFGMFSLFLREQLYIGEACWAFLFGVVIGPYGANVFNPRSWGDRSDAEINAITLEITRVILAVGVFAIGVELPKAYIARHWRSIFFLLLPVMSWGWLVSAALIYAFIPTLNFVSCLAVAACLTPTDPILAAAVIGGKYADRHVPAHLRHLLAAESGCNDGAAFPFLYIALYLILEPNKGHAIRDWFIFLWLYQVALGIAIGSSLGFSFRHLMKFCQRKELIDRQSYVAQYVALALLTLGITTLLGSDDLLATFSCGTAFAWDGFFNRQTEEAVFSSVIDLLFNVAAFVYVGAWMPFEQFQDRHLALKVWRLLVIAILVLLLKRLPIIIALYKWIPDIRTFREALFSGHFGPIGIGAVSISTLAAEYLPRYERGTPPANQRELLAGTIQPIVAFMVLCSVAVHGLSVPSFSLGKRVHTVSRTWSRHALPDWTNQTRVVQPGEAIVINRDDDIMERGELVPGENNEKKSDAVATSTGECMSESATRLGESRVSSESVKEEILADGTENVLEWKEGDCVVIERRCGPAEEAEVEMLKDAQSPSSSVESINVLRKQSISEKMGSHRQRSESKEAGPGGDLGDGWVSEMNVQPCSESSTFRAADRKKRPKAAKQKQSQGTKPKSLNRSRRRLSFRNRLSGYAVHGQLRQTPVESSDQGEALHMVADEDKNSVDVGALALPSTVGMPNKGKERHHGSQSRPDTGSTSLESYARNQRLESLRTAHSRDASPSRSVRFADERERSRTGCSTPRGDSASSSREGSVILDYGKGDNRTKAGFVRT